MNKNFARDYRQIVVLIFSKFVQNKSTLFPVKYGFLIIAWGGKKLISPLTFA